MQNYVSKAMRAIGGLGLGSAVATGASDMAHVLGYGTPDMPGPYLALPAALFAIGQTARTVRDIQNRPEYWSDMPFVYRLPRYAKNIVSTAAPYLALGFLMSGNPDIAEAGALGSSAGWIVSETVLDRAAKWAENKYLSKHPEIRIRHLEEELAGLKGQDSK